MNENQKSEKGYFNQGVATSEVIKQAYVDLALIYSELVTVKEKHGQLATDLMIQWRSKIILLFHIVKKYEKQLKDIDILATTQDYDGLLNFTQFFLELEIFSRILGVEKDGLTFEDSLGVGFR